jgi:nitrogen fixation/metabolism regulation signal transduction histidine kinase
MAHPGRKKTFVDPKVQGALVRRLVFHWCTFIVVAGLVAFCLQVLSNPFISLREHARNVYWTHGPFLMVLFFLLPVFIVDTIKLSHRFAGPIYRLRQTIRTLAKGGAYQPMKFRELDFWQGLADDFNQMVERLTAAKNDQAADSNEAADEPAEPALAAK